MSGCDAQRGFIFQSIIAMIECLDRNDWNEIKLEPNTRMDKVDIQLYRDGTVISAIQVKSSINQFERFDVKNWLEELKKDAADADKAMLYLVGDAFAPACNDYIGKNSDEIRKISLNHLEDICIGKLVKYVKNEFPSDDVRLKDLELIDESLFSKIHRNSTTQERMTRKAFEDAFHSVLAIQLYDRLMNIFTYDREGHPSIRMMNPDPNLFPKGLPEIKSDGRYVVVNDEPPRAIKDMILDSWKRDDKKHILLVGEGGIGKTVAMLTLPQENWFQQYRIPVVYVQLQRLDAYEGKLNNYLSDKFGTDYNYILDLAKLNPKRHPYLLLLLDGFNEIPDKYIGTAEKFIRIWMEMPGVQIITTSRLGFSLENSFSKYQLQILPRETVESFLLSAGIKKEDFPSINDQIWKVINVPLMLTLYTKIDKVRKIADRSSVSFLLDWKEEGNAANIIWNYLQTELYRFIDKANASYSPMQYATAILAVAPYICCQMSHRTKFYINREDLQSFIKQALFFYCVHHNLLNQQLKNFEEEYGIYMEKDLFQEKMTGNYLRILVDNLALFQKQRIRDENGGFKYTYSLVHQNFRDAMASFFIGSCLLEVYDSREKTILLDYADYYIKNYIAEYLSDNELIKIWNRHRDEEPEDGRITWILMDIIGRRKAYDYHELDFSNLDLSKTNMYMLLSQRPDICALPKKRESFNRTRLSMTSFLPEGHTDLVNSLSYSPDGRKLVSGSKDGTVRLLDLESGSSCVLGDGLGSVTSVSYSSDGRQVACGSSKGIVKIWDLKSGNSSILDDYSDGVTSVLFSPDSNRIASGSYDGKVKIRDIERGTERELNGQSSGVFSLSYSPDGRLLASGSNRGKVQVWDLSNESGFDLSGHFVSYSPDGRHLASDAGCGNVQVWDLKSRTSRIFTRVSSSTGRITYSPNGRYIASGSQKNTVQILDLNNGTSHVLGSDSGGDFNQVNCVSYSPDGRQLASGSYDGTVRIWDLENETYRDFKGYSSLVKSLSYSLDGRHLACGLNDGSVRVLNMEKNTWCILTGHAAEVNCVLYSPDGRELTTCSTDGTVRIWNLENGTSHVLESYLKEMNIAAYSSCGRKLSCCSVGGTVKIWDLDSWESRVLEMNLGWNRSSTYSPDGRKLASVTDEGLRIYDLDNETYHDFDKYSNHDSVFFPIISFSPDGRKLVRGNGDKLRITDLESGVSNSVNINTRFQITSLAFNSDGRQLAVGLSNGVVRVVEMESKEHYDLKGHLEEVVSILYSPDGRWIASASSDSTLIIWNATTGEPENRYRFIYKINLYGANFSQAIISADDRVLLGETGAIIRLRN